MKKVNLKILKKKLNEQIDQDDLESSEPVSSSPDKGNQGNSDQDIQKVVSACGLEGKQYRVKKVILENCVKEMERLEANPDGVVKDYAKAARRADAQDQGPAVKSANTGMKQSKQGGTEGQQGCLDAMGGSLWTTSLYGVVGPVTTIWAYKTFFGPSSSWSLSAPSKAIRYFARNAGSYVTGAGWDKTTEGARRVKEQLKNFRKKVSVTGRSVSKLATAGRGAAAIGTISGLTFGGLYGHYYLENLSAQADKSAGKASDDDLMAQQEMNVKMAAEASMAMEFSAKNQFFKWWPSIRDQAAPEGTPSSGIFDPCAWAAYIIGTGAAIAMTRFYRGFKPTKSQLLTRSISTVAREAAAETRSIAEGYTRLGEKFFDGKILDDIKKQSNVGLLSPSRSGLVNVAPDVLDEIDDALRAIFTGASDEAIEAAEEALSNTLTNLQKGAGFDEAIAYIQEVTEKWQQAERAYARNVSQGATNTSKFINTAAEAVSGGITKFMKYPFSWMAKRSGKADDIADATGQGPKILNTSDDMVDTASRKAEDLASNSETKLAGYMDEYAKELDELDAEAFLKFRNNLPGGFNWIRGLLAWGNILKPTNRSISDIAAAAKAGREMLGKNIYDDLLDDAARAGANQLDGPLGQLFSQTSARNLPIHQASEKLVKNISEELSETIALVVQDKKFQGALVAAFRRIVSEIKKSPKQLDDSIETIAKRYDLGVDEVTETLGIPPTIDLFEDSASALAARRITLDAEKVEGAMSTLKNTMERRIPGYKAGFTNLNIGPKLAATLKWSAVISAVIGIPSWYFSKINAMTVTASTGEGSDKIIKKQLKEIPEGEEGFLSDKIVRSIYETWVGKEAQAAVIRQHFNLIDGNVGPAQREFVKNNLNSILFRDYDKAEEIFKAGLIQSKSKKAYDRSQDSFFKLCRRIKTGEYNGRGDVNKILDDFSKLRKNVLRNAIALKDAESAAVSGTRNQQLRKQELREKVMKVMGGAYISSGNERLRQQINKLMTSPPSDRDYRTIVSAFVMNDDMVGPVLKYIIEDLGNQNEIIQSEVLGKKDQKPQNLEQIKKLKAMRKEREEEIRKLQNSQDSSTDLDIGATATIRMQINNAKEDIKQIDAEIKRLGGDPGETNESRKISIFNRKDLSNLVFEVLTEGSYGKGYSPYPYHSDIGTDEEPADDYIEDWKDFELSVVRDETKDTAIELAKILIKDLELFGDVVDLVGKNQSVGTEILKKFKKK